MKIAQVAPLFERVPPRAYGGTERVVSTLTDGLSWAGHEVTLFATNDSRVDAELVGCRAEPIVSGSSGDTSEAADHILEFDRLRCHLDEFDIVHFHTRFSHFPLFEDIASRTVTTCHNRVDFPTLADFFRRFRRFPLIAISDAQRRTQPLANWAGTIHHGYPLDQYVFYDHTAPGEGYLAFLGRICPEKGILQAIRIARNSKRKLKIAARINGADREYFEECVEHLIDGDQVELVGEISEDEKTDFLNGAAAVLFPIQWPEPFGLVLIEAMACGTPVIAFHEASVPEILEDGVTGFIVESTEAATEAVGRLDTLDRRKIRERFESDFSAERMISRHIELYKETLRNAQGSLSSHSVLRRALKGGSILGPDEPHVLTGRSEASRSDEAH